jgi:aspartate kinase
VPHGNENVHNHQVQKNHFLDFTSEIASVLSIGEQHTASLLALALQKNNILSRSFLARDAGIFVKKENLYCNATIDFIETKNIQNFLNKGGVPVIAGFQGMHPRDLRVSTLEREASDCSAVSIAVAFKAVACEFFKDVNGLYEDNPKKNPQARRYKILSYEKALSLISKSSSENSDYVLHPLCVQEAQAHNMPLFIRKIIVGNTEKVILQPPEKYNHLDVMPPYERSINKKTSKGTSPAEESYGTQSSPQSLFFQTPDDVGTWIILGDHDVLTQNQ